SLDRLSSSYLPSPYGQGESQQFWTSLLRNVYGVEYPEKYIQFEDQVHLDNTSFIDGYIPETRVMIEQKGLGKNLNQPIRQSDGTFLTPFQQAKRYIVELPVDMHPRYVITCNFAEIWVYDMNNPKGEPEKILLENLETEYYRLQFLVQKDNDHLKRELEVSIAAGEIVGLIYDAFAKQYMDPNSPHTLHSLNVLCVRLVFCLYAENSGIFGHYGMFHDYLATFETRQMRKALVELFKILDTKEADRDPYLKYDNPALAEFPYVNGGLFADEDIEIPPFTDEIRTLLLDKASAGFNWSEISPTIFGAVFESTLNPETRRSGGMHYTSIENIHKVIDPLFLDDLKKEFEDIRAISVENTRKKKLTEFQRKLASLTFLDPACGSGNFLTESYLSLRRIENDVLRELSHGQISFGDENLNPIMVGIGQFYGIEINDFAVTVAKTALWIAESQMLHETETIVQLHLDFLPLKSYTNIVEGNALRIDWASVIPPSRLSYIMGNPPFIGYSLQSKDQKDDILSIYVDEKGKPYKTAGKIDYVSGWYFKAARLMQDTAIRTAFVSTNSITQGEQVAAVWKPLFDRLNIHIDFAYRTFRWDSEASLKAHVHCVIIGFSIAPNPHPKSIYDGDRVQIVNNINAYLIDGPDIFIESSNTVLCDVPSMRSGGKPVEGGNLIFTEAEKDEFLKKEPKAQKFFRPFMGSDDFINGHGRWCLWLISATPQELRSMPAVLERVEAVRNFRLASVKPATREFANQPARFMEIKQPDSDYLMIPATSSETRRYIPIGYLDKDVIASNAASFVPNATLYHFGVLTSNVHMAWMRAVCGRLEMRYRYSINIVYNNFPWPEPTEEQKQKIEETAQAILDARDLYPDSSLADLYDEVSMPPELRKAHQHNDRAVMAAYDFNVKETTETSCVAALMKLYQDLVSRS
ncbi:MAG: methylase, partial [Clostridia bacterium]|nr:methylase [Clostridia bacterium]